LQIDFGILVMFLTIFSTVSCSYNFGLKSLGHLQLKFEESTAILLRTHCCSAPHPMQCWTSGKIAGTSFQHCMWGWGKG